MVGVCLWYTLAVGGPVRVSPVKEDKVGGGEGGGTDCLVFEGRLGVSSLASCLFSSIEALVVSALVMLVLVGLLLLVARGSILGCSPAHPAKGMCIETSLGH